MLTTSTRRRVAPKQSAKTLLWATYERVMTTARERALELADALERHIRTAEHQPGWMGRFQAACAAADAYASAVLAAQRYHFGTIPLYSSGHVINLDGVELLAVIRELRGTAIPVVVESAGDRKLVAYQYADDGIAGYFAVEVRSMRRFGSPRRTPADEAGEVFQQST